MDNIDLYCLLNWIDPDWRDHFIDPERALASYSALTDEEMETAIEESGARYE